MRRGLSLGWRMVLLVAGIPLLVLTPLLLYVGQRYRDAYRGAYWGEANLATIQVQQTINAIAPFVETIEDAPGLTRLLENTDENVDDFAFIALVTSGGRIVKSSLPGYAGRTMTELSQLDSGATVRGEGDEAFAVVRRDLPSGDTYLVWRSMEMPGDPDSLLYIVVAERSAVVEPPLFPLIAIGVVAALGVVVLIRISLYRLVIAPLSRLAEGAAVVGGGDLSHRIVLDREDELGLVARTFNEMTARVRRLVSKLEERVAERTATLQRRNAQLEAVSVVAQAAARQRNVNALLEATVNAISANFGFYHTGIFILDDDHEWAILRAASSEGGKRMLARGHRLQVGRVGIVGYVAASGRPRVAFKVGEDSVWFENPDLPETRAEMALPLMNDDGIVGVLDVQSDQEPDGGGSSFTDEDIRTLQLMADQLTIALANARANETTEAALGELQALQADYARQGWARVSQRMRPQAYEYDRLDTTPVPPLPVPDDLAKGRVPHRIVMDGEAPVVMEALRVGGRTLGFLGLSDPNRVWSEEELALVDSVGEQVAMALDNARLFEDTQNNERRQYLISRVLQVASSAAIAVGDMLSEIAAILAQSLDMSVVVLTFPNPSQPIVRSQVVVDSDGRQLHLPEEVAALSREQYTFFQGLESADLGPMVSLPSLDELAERYDLERVLYVPIQSAGTRKGVIGFIQRPSSPPLDPDTRDLVQSLAGQIAVALDNRNLAEEARRRSEELRQLYMISLELSEQLAPEDVLSVIVKQGAVLVGADAANFWIYQTPADSGSDESSIEELESGEKLRLAYEYGDGAEGHVGYATSAHEGLAGAALTARRTMLLRNHAGRVGHLPELRSDRFRSVLAAPLVGRFGPLGVFVALSEQEGFFGERETRLADLFSAQAATALENARLNRDAQGRAEAFSQLYDAGIDLITVLDADVLVDRAANWARQIFAAERAVIILRDPSTTELTRGISVGEDRYAPIFEDPSRDYGVVERILATGQSMLVPDARDSAAGDYSRLVDAGLVSEMGTSLRIGDEVLGAVLVDGAAPRQFGGDDIGLLEFLATQISSALQNAIQFSQTEQALSVVMRQARYQTNVSQAVALLNDRGTGAAAEVLSLLGEASALSAVLYYETVGRNGESYWHLKASWIAEEMIDREGNRAEAPEAWAAGSLEPDDLASWRHGLIERGQVMFSQEDLPVDESSSLARFDFGAVLGLGVPGQGGLPSFLALFREDEELWSEQEIVALQTVAAAFSNTIARESLLQQVRETLSETETLYRGGAELSEARTYDRILAVLLEHSVLGRDPQSATLQLFDRPWTADQRPETVEVVAYWGDKPETTRRRYWVDRSPQVAESLADESPVFVENLESDTSPDRRARILFQSATGARSAVIVPLIVGGQRIGFLQAGYAHPQIFSGPARRRLVTLAQQAAIVALNIRQLRATEARVAREQLIRQITGRIQEAADVDGVLQTAVREIGQAFGTSRNRIQFRVPQETAGPPSAAGATETSGKGSNGHPDDVDDGDERLLDIGEG